MPNAIINTTTLPITGIYDNLAFSSNEVWAWYTLPVPESEYGVYPEHAGLPKYLKAQLSSLTTQSKRKKLKYHMLVSTTIAGQTPNVIVGLKLGDRNEGEEPFMPKIFQKFVNLVADAPLDDYISDKELNFWQNVAKPYDTFFGRNLGFQLCSSNQLAYLVKKKFFPAMQIDTLPKASSDQEEWGESFIAEIAQANIVAHPKYLEITQKQKNQLVTGFRTSLEILKYGDNVEYPEFETWLPYIKSFPFIADFSIRFTATKDGFQDIITHISVESNTLEDLIERAEDLVVHYEAANMYTVWNSGDQISLLKESIPTGVDADAKKRPKASELAITHIQDYLTFSKQDVYAWVSIPLTQFEYLDDSSKKGLAYGLDVALSGLISSEDKNAECHLIIQGSPFDARGWVQHLNSRIEENSPLPYNRQFLTEMYQHVEDSDFRERTVLLGVNIGRRTAYAPNKTVTPTFKENLLNIIPPVVSDNVSEKEVTFWKTMGNQLISSLVNSRIRAVAATAEEVAFAIRKNFFPDMPLPSPQVLSLGGNKNTWKRNELAYLADGSIENNSRYLKITQIVDGVPMTGYRATLCFSKFPETMYFPYGDPWIHYASLLPFPTDFSLRFTIEPARKVRKEVGKKLKDVIDQAINMESAGGSTSIEVNEHLRAGEELEYTLKKDPAPWVYGRYRITVEASTVEELKERAKQVIDHYRALEIQVTWPTGDQLNLLKEGMPNDMVRVPSYYHRTTLPIISAGVPTGTGTVGDRVTYSPQGEARGWLGQYLGYTTGQTQEPVFLNMHSTIDTNSRNGLAICGSPGSGKTFAALTLTYQTVLSGAWTIYLDPKADAGQIANLPGLEGHSRVLDLKNGAPGIIDPFLIGETLPEQKDLALETIYIFLGGMDKVTEEQQVQLSIALDTITTRRANPSLTMIVEYLVNSTNHAARSLGAKLHVLIDLPYANLCFAHGEASSRLRPENGLTIITLLGLQLPDAETSRESYTNANRLALGILYLLCSFTYQLMLGADKSHPKNIIIDEAWAITSTKQGTELVKKVAKMGRAHNVALMLVSQNPQDFAKDGVTNSISTRLAFGSEDPEPALNFLGLETSDTNKETVRGLSNGECLMRDWSGRIARVYVDAWNAPMTASFETNPRQRAKSSQ